MRAVVRSWAVWVLGMALSGAAWGHETDQYSTPPGREFADLGPEFTPWVYTVLERAVSRANQEIEESIRAGRGGTVQTPEQLGALVFSQFPNAYNTIEGIEAHLYSPGLAAKYPGSVVGAKQSLGQIYQRAHFPLDPRRVFKIWFASTMKIYGVYCGADKIGHFVDMGHNYFIEYRRAIRNGRGDAEARRIAVRMGTDHPIFSETGVLGYVSAGAYSNADLAANYVGLLFYINLTEPVKLKGAARPPMLDRDGPYWKLAPHVRPNSDFFSWFVSDHYDEALNPSKFDGSMRGGMRRAIRDRADNLLWRYRDPHGCRRPVAYFDGVAEDLRTYWGEPYGHNGERGELITLTEVCFEPVPESSREQEHNRTGHTALHWAVEMGDAAGVRRLLQRKFPVDAPMKPTGDFAGSEVGNTALHLAAALGRADVIDLLLGGGANVSATNRRGATPLHMAGTGEAAARLIARGADVNAVDLSGRTPLHWAAQGPAQSAVPALLDAGADAARADRQGLTPLHLATIAGDEATVGVLLGRGAGASAADRRGVTPLHAAAQRGDVAIVRRLLNANAPADARDGFGYTPLHLAATSGSPSVAAALLEYGADANVADAYHVTPLLLAARHASRTVVDLLLEAGANPGAQSAGPSTPLHEAAAANDRPIVMRLLAAGAPPKVRDHKSRTPRDVAQAMGYVNVVEAFDGLPASPLAVPRVPFTAAQPALNTQRKGRYR